MTGEAGPFDAEPFGFRITKDRRLLIERGGRTVSIVAGTAAQQLIARLDAADERATQLHLARATGNYKRGNERPR
jgi:hypothetical protein